MIHDIQDSLMHHSLPKVDQSIFYSFSTASVTSSLFSQRKISCTTSIFDGFCWMCSTLKLRAVQFYILGFNVSGNNFNFLEVSTCFEGEDNFNGLHIHIQIVRIKTVFAIQIINKESRHILTAPLPTR
jgi:hypothetical protein